MKNTKFEIDSAVYEEIEKIIASADSPVGIDTKKTHIIILHKLDDITKRLEKIERRLKKKIESKKFREPI